MLLRLGVVRYVFFFVSHVASESHKGLPALRCKTYLVDAGQATTARRLSAQKTATEMAFATQLRADAFAFRALVAEHAAPCCAPVSCAARCSPYGYCLSPAADTFCLLRELDAEADMT